MHMLAAPNSWAADDLERLPEDDGNKYEIVDGRLLVTPAPSLAHEAVLNELAARIRAYVGPQVRAHASAQALGQLFHRNDLKFDDCNCVDPDLSVVRVSLPVGTLTWRDVPRPLLIVEVLSKSTRTHDLVGKAALYAREGIPLAWIVDHRERVVHVVRPGAAIERCAAVLEWHPEGRSTPLSVNLPAFFNAVIGPPISV